MAIVSRGFTGSVDQEDWANMITASSGNGLTSTYGGTGFSAALSAGARTFVVQPGALWANGVYVEMDAAATTTAAAANSSGLPRIDLLVMRVNWATKASALAVIEGTPAGSPQPPTFGKVPGSLVDIPLWEARLNSGGSAYVSGSAVSRRYWVQDGIHVVPSTVRLPDMPLGRIVARPGDDGGLLVGNTDSASPMELKSWSDSGYVDVGVAAPNGFTGTLKGCVLNGVVELRFDWTKASTSTGSNVTFSSASLPVGWRPRIDIERNINAGDNHCRVYVSAAGGMQFGPLTLAAGQRLGGGFTYFRDT